MVADIDKKREEQMKAIRNMEKIVRRKPKKNKKANSRQLEPLRSSISEDVAEQIESPIVVEQKSYTL